MSVQPKEVEELRSAFLQYVQTQGETCVHPNDLNRVKTDDAWLTRFLMHHDNDQKLALDMMKEALEWRKSFKVNEINADNLRMDYMVDGGFFPRGRDKDGSALLIFKCKKHQKGARDMDDVKRCVIYWMEKLERDEKGKPITIFFDMEGCGVSNMDMDFTKYLIGLFKLYYPYFLNYIIIYEMSWILNTALTLIKSLLPPKAVQKIQMLKKASVLTFVPEDQALKCWGGKDEYVFSFVPDKPEVNNTPASSNKKVHFATEHGDQMNDSAGSWDKESAEGGALVTSPSSLLTFAKDGDEFVSTLEIKNTDPKQNISYKLKTNAPQKFRVRPSAGCLAPGEVAHVSIYLLPAYQVSGLSRDKFLVMSVPVANIMSISEVTELWKTTPSETVTQIRLRCVFPNADMPKNSASLPVQTPAGDSQQLAKIVSSMVQVQESQTKIEKSLCFSQIMQIINFILLVIIGIVVIFILRNLNAEYEVPVDERSSAYYNQDHTDL